MKLPNGNNAVVEIVKLRDYSLSPRHPHGRHKARIFSSLLGLQQGDSAKLRQILLEVAARSEVAAMGEQDDFGQRYVIDFIMSGPAKSATVRSTWIVRTGEDIPRLTSCYVLLRK